MVRISYFLPETSKVSWLPDYSQQKIPSCRHIRSSWEYFAEGGLASGVEKVVRESIEKAKSLGAANAANVAKATFKALSQLSTREEVYERRGLELPKAAPAAETN